MPLHTCQGISRVIFHIGEAFRSVRATLPPLTKSKASGWRHRTAVKRIRRDRAALVATMVRSKPATEGGASLKRFLDLNQCGDWRDGYHFMTDMTNQAIAWTRFQQSMTPDRPFFMYFAPGATHAPHHVSKEWSDKYKGKFDAGWDKYREEALARQITGTPQKPFEGVSLAYTFDDAMAKDRHRTQYFEIVGNRGIYHDGWLARTVHRAAVILFAGIGVLTLRNATRRIGVVASVFAFSSALLVILEPDTPYGGFIRISDASVS